MGEHTHKFVKEKETKNTVRYHDPTSERPLTFYIPKEWFSWEEPYPESIELIVKW